MAMAESVSIDVRVTGVEESLRRNLLLAIDCERAMAEELELKAAEARSRAERLCDILDALKRKS